MNNKILKISIKLASVLLILCLALYLSAAFVYSVSFGYRYETAESEAFSIEDFPNMKRERHSFESMQGHELVGYLYESSDAKKSENALIVFAHGLGGGGQTGYMEIFGYLVENGFYVFAYDATANDESEGKVMGGLPQGYIDLDYAITYATELKETKDLPLVLMGYSWGGLSVGNVLNYHPEATAVVSLAGWDKSTDIMGHVGQNLGDKIGLLLPFFALHEQIKYGKYAGSSSISGFENSDCKVMIVHGVLDTTVPIALGYEKYYERYGTSDRFTFKKFDDRDHDVYHNSDGSLDTDLFSQVVDFINQSLE